MKRPNAPFVNAVELRTEKVESYDAYPFNIPAVKQLEQGRLSLDQRATIFVGENGAGKSTLLEAIAVAAGLNAEGGSKNFRFSTRASESPLHRCIRLVRTARRPLTSYFFRAESFFNVATTIEELDAQPAFSPPIIDSYGGTSLHEQSHGESFMALLEHRFGPRGLYIFDEPEAALSVRRQIQLLGQLNEHITTKGSQLIIATHSPVLMALAGAAIYRLDRSGITEIAYHQTEAFCLMTEFLLDPERFT